MASVEATLPPQQGLRDWRCQTAGAAAPAGDSAAHEVATVGVKGHRAGPPQARPAPSGGSAAHEVASVGAISLEADRQSQVKRDFAHLLGRA